MLNAWEALKRRYKDEDIKFLMQPSRPGPNARNGIQGFAIVSFAPHTKYDAYLVEASGRRRLEVLSGLAEAAERLIQKRNM